MDVEFLNSLRIEVIPPWTEAHKPHKSMILLIPLRFRDKDGQVYMVPEGFRSDGASVPRLLRWLVPRFTRTIYAGFLHDWLIRLTIVNDFKADMIFHRALRCSGVGPIYALRMWVAVTAGSLFRPIDRLLGTHIVLSEPE
jgi:hypothetical protein